MLANKYCQLMCEQGDLFQIDDQGRFFSNQYAAVAEQYLRPAANDNKRFGDNPSKANNSLTVIIGGAGCALIAGFVAYLFL